MEELSQALDEVFRREKGRVVGALVRMLGSIDAAEEAFQEAVLAALPGWRARRRAGQSGSLADDRGEELRPRRRAPQAHRRQEGAVARGDGHDQS